MKKRIKDAIFFLIGWVIILTKYVLPPIVGVIAIANFIGNKQSFSDSIKWNSLSSWLWWSTGSVIAGCIFAIIGGLADWRDWSKYPFGWYLFAIHMIAGVISSLIFSLLLSFPINFSSSITPFL